MNDPIISPWIFYFLGLLCPLNTFLFLAVGFSIIGAIISFLHKTDCDERLERWPEDNYHINRAKKATKIFYTITVFLIFSSILSIFLPSKSTVIQMIIASKVTPANISKATDFGERAVDKIIEKIIESSKKFDMMHAH